MQHFFPRWLLTFGGTFLTLAAVAQAPRPSTPWTDAPAARAALATTHWAGRLTAFRPVTADPAALAATLAAAPLEGTPAAPLLLSLPHPDGSLVRFQVVEAPVMAPALAARFPNIKTYAGIGLDDPTATLRADLTPEGFHAQVLSRREGGTFYIDPIQNTDMARGLVVYDRRNLRPLPGQQMVCETGAPGTGTTPAPVIGGPAPVNPTAQRINTSLGGTLRTYRLAVAATGEYTAFHGGTVALAQAAIVTTINRVNGVYEKELAVRMVLVANNTSIIYTNAGTDPYANSSGDLNANQTNINTVIGSANYDIGHLVGTGGGGVAQLGSVCGTSKARGLTGSSAPVGDAFDIDYVAHEIGHQFSGNHPFNGSTGSCTGGNRNAATAWEPGSGSTIQGYAGICSPQNLQSNSDAYFHGGNISEMTTFINSTTCPATAASGNTPPTVGTPASESIPASTPFRLTATASDADGDVLSYCWEEMDLGPQGAPVTTTTQTANSTVPLFRSFTPVASSTRYFPRLNELRNNTTVYGEFLPSVARTMAFRCTVRDQRFSTGLGRIVGGVNQSNTVTLTVVDTGTPFAVTVPNTAVSYPGGSTQTVNWTVAGTTAAPISCATVNIRLSTDGGLTFPTVLAAAEPNDGSTSVTIPNTPGTTCRVMVEANDNYFFDISNADFTITPGVNSPTITSFTPTTGGVGTSVVITGTNLTGTSAVRFNGVASASVSGVTATSVTATVPAGASTGFIGLTATGGTATSSTVFTVPGAPTVTSFTPTAGGAGTSVTVTGTNFTGATGATFNGTAAAVTVVNATTLTTTVPAGATTGPISVTTPLGTGTSASNFTVTPANDECTGTLPLLACGGSVTGTTVGSTSTNDPTATCSTVTIEPASGGIWYRFIGTGGSTTLSTNGAAYDSKLFVYSGSCGALVCVTANDDISGGNLASAVTFTGTAGTTYFLFVSGFNGEQGTFTLTATCTAPTITSFTPNTGPVGTSVSVTGTLLATASAVTVNNVAGTITGTPTATNVTFTVGAGSTTGVIRITTGAGVATSATNFTVSAPPTITSFTPTTGAVGTSVTITGTNLTGTSAVSFNGVAAITFANVNATTVTATVPAGASTGFIGLTATAGTATSSTVFTVPPPPTITSFTPTSGAVGTSVGLTGTNFTAASAVTFNGTAATTFTVNSATSITATVPAGATTGPIGVTAPGGSGVSASNFTVILAPTLTSLSPTSGMVGTVVTLTGTGFTGATAVSFNGTAAVTFGVTNATTATATVPAGATSGNVTITTAGGTSNGVAFTVLPSLSSLTLSAGSLSPAFAPATTAYTLSTTSASTTATPTNAQAGGGPITVNGTAVTSGTVSGPIALAPGANTLTVVVNPPGAGPATTYTVTVTRTACVVTALAQNVSVALDASGNATVAATAVNNGSSSTCGPVGLALSQTAFTCANVGPNAVTLTVTDGFGGSATANATVTVTAPPTATLTGLSPNPAPAGTTVTATGTNLSGATALTVNGATAAISNLTATGFTFVVPAGAAATGNVVLTLPCAQSLTQPFATAFPSLTISTGTLGSPTTVPAGTYSVLTVTGTGVAQLVGATAVVGAVQVSGALLTNCQTLTGAASFVLAAGATLGICDVNGISATGSTGAVQTSGTRSFSSDANYLYNGTLAQTTGPGLPATVRSLTTTNANDVTLTQPLTIAQTLTIAASGNLALNGQPLTLRSDATGTALVVNAGTGVVTGTATVQRAINGSLNPGPGYRHFSAPVANTTVADLATAGFTPEVSQASTYNTSATPGTTTPFPTVFGYDQARLISASNSNFSAFDKGFFVPAGLGAALTPGRGYAVNISASPLVDFQGTLNTGPYPVALARTTGPTAADAGWAMVGNPYPAPLDFSLIAPADRPGLDASMYVFESTGPYTGSYRAYVNGIGGSPLIGSSQAFWVRVSTGLTTGTLTFRNAHRLTDYAQQVPVQRGGADTRPLVQLALTGNGAADAAYLYAEAGATAGVDAAFDAVKLANSSGLNLAAVSATGEALAIDGRPGFGTAQRVALQVAVPATGPYTLTAAALANLPATTAVTLTDVLTGTTTDLRRTSSYRFTAAATAPATGRFFLNLTPAGALATATPSGSHAFLLHPNPALNEVRIDLTGLPTGTYHVTLLDVTGRLVQALTLDAGLAHAVQLDHLASGTYLVLVQGTKAQATLRLRQRLVKE